MISRALRGSLRPEEIEQAKEFSSNIAEARIVQTSNC